MATRTQRKTVAFGHPYRLKGVDRVLPPGDYEVVTDEELIEGLSFPVYHRVSTAIIVPAQSHQASSVEMVVIDPRDLQAAQDRDASAHQPRRQKLIAAVLARFRAALRSRSPRSRNRPPNCGSKASCTWKPMR